jgi:hypothetical protein
MKVSSVVLAYCLLALFGQVRAEESAMSYRLFSCDVHSDYVSLVFRNESGHGSHIAFMDPYREIALESRSTKGLLKWSNTIAVYAAALKSRGQSFLTIKYRNPDDSVHVFEAGMIGNSCLSVLRNRYGSALKFIDQELQELR